MFVEGIRGAHVSLYVGAWVVFCVGRFVGVAVWVAWCGFLHVRCVVWVVGGAARGGARVEGGGGDKQQTLHGAPGAEASSDSWTHTYSATV